MRKILVVGGAGYIGSHMLKTLDRAGCTVVTLDNLLSGYRDAVHYGSLVVGDLQDRDLLDSLFKQHQFDAVMHFASSIEVGESVVNPAKYYRNIVSNSLNLLETMLEYKVKNLIYSSTAAIFGQPEYTPIDEQHPRRPVNPYGTAKHMVEMMLNDFDDAYGIKSISLRYFNAAGADPHGELGERHDPETHLIPLILQTASGRREKITIYGDDYDTEDGTCIRDYIHVADLCDAHLLALDKLLHENISRRYNLGNGKGFSVKQIIDAASSVTGKEIPVEIGRRRNGDPEKLIADSALIRKELGWEPNFNNIETIVQHAWEWEKKHFSATNN